MRRPNPVQTGKAAELRFCSLVILGSGGAIELVPPLADDERRDFELHLKHRFGIPISVQVRVRTSLRSGILTVEFHHGKRRPLNPAFWFFVAYLDLKTMDFADPVFVIPSRALRRANRLIRKGQLSMRKRSRDRYAQYRVTRLELGARLLQILEQAGDGRRVVAA